MIKAAILGATGYAGIELVRLLSGHPEAGVQTLYSHSFAGQQLSDVYPGFLGRLDAVLQDLEDLDCETLAREHDAIFAALPHGRAMDFVRQLYPHAREHGTHLIDLSADFRYNSVDLYNTWYPREHCAGELLSRSVYGIPELYRSQIATAEIVGNPGCYPTVSLLSTAPPLWEGLISCRGLIIDAKSGVSGAGRTPSDTTHFSNVHNNFRAYKVTRHRHASEIREKIEQITRDTSTLVFTPHLVPMQRGILATIYAEPGPNLPSGDPHGALADCYRRAYGEERFIRIHPDGQLPQTREVQGTNCCAIGFRIDDATGRVIIIGAIDNLCRGASGQAVQNMNILAGIQEDAWFDMEFVL